MVVYVMWPYVSLAAVIPASAHVAQPCIIHIYTNRFQVLWKSTNLDELIVKQCFRVVLIYSAL